MRDANLLFRNTTASLTETETSAWLTINGAPNVDLLLVVDIPKGSIGDTVAGAIQFSANGSDAQTPVLNLFFIASRTEATTVSRKIERKFSGRFKYARLVLTVAGTSPDFGAVQAYLEIGGNQNKHTVGQNVTGQEDT